MRAGLGLAALLLAVPAWGHDALEVVRVVRVYDGDTFFVDLRCPVPVLCDAVGIRLRGIDTPELRGACLDERARARQAREHLAARLDAAETVRLHAPERGKYFRLVAHVIADGVNVGQALLAAGLARPYTGGARQGWCAEAVEGQ